MNVIVIPNVSGALGTFIKGMEKETGVINDNEIYQVYPDQSTVKINYNISRDLEAWEDRHMKNHHIKESWISRNNFKN